MQFPGEFMCGWRVKEANGYVVGVDVVTSPSPHQVVTQALGQLGLGLSDVFAECNEISVRAPIGADHISRVQLPASLDHLPSDVRERIAYTALVGSHDLFIVVQYIKALENLVRKLVPRYVEANHLTLRVCVEHQPLVQIIDTKDEAARYRVEQQNVIRMRPSAQLAEHEGSMRLRLMGFHTTFPLRQWAHNLVPTMVSLLILEHLSGAHFVAGTDSIN